MKLGRIFFRLPETNRKKNTRKWMVGILLRGGTDTVGNWLYVAVGL